MKLAFLIQKLHPAAGQTYTISEIIKYLSSAHKDWQFDVLSPVIDYPITDAMKAENVRVNKIDQLYSSVIFSGRFAKRLREYDLIYVKGSLPYVFPASRSGRPNILVVHQPDSPKLFRSFDMKFRVIAANILIGFVLKRPDAVVTVTKELADFYFHKYGIKLKVIEDQFSNSFFEMEARVYPVRDGEVKLLSVGYWDGYNGRKRQDILLKYFSTAVDHISNLRLTLVGLSEESLKELRNLSSNYGISERITLKGHLSEPELINEYASNDVYATATTYEGFYRQIIEAFATGMPALVYDARKMGREQSQFAAVNHLLNSKGGELYDSPASFVNSLEKILRNYQEFSDKARLYAQRYRSDVIGKKTEILISELIQRNLG